MRFGMFVFILMMIPETRAFYDEDQYVVSLSSKDFVDLVIKSKTLWIVQFFSQFSDECQKFRRDFSRAAQAFGGLVKFGAVNGDDNVELTLDQGADEYPTVIVYNGPKGVPQIYTDKREARTLTSFITVIIHAMVTMKLDGVSNPAMFKSRTTDDLTETNFQDLVLNSKKMWLVVIYVHFSSECTRLSQKWDYVEKELAGIVKMGSLDAVANYFTAGQCKLYGYPTVKFFPRGKKKISLGLTYTGQLVASDIVEWVFKMAAESSPLPEVVQITNNVAWEDACNQKRACIITFIPQSDVCDKKCRDDYLSKLHSLKVYFKKQFWGWCWSQGQDQPKLEEALEINRTYPSMVAMKLRTKEYDVSYDAFTKENVFNFLSNVSKCYFKSTVKKDIPIEIVSPLQNEEL